MASGARLSKLSPSSAKNNLKLLTQKDFITLPWKNGGGATTELLRLANPQDPNNFLFRLSVAQISQSGPFSIFEHCDRILILLDGAGVELDFDGKKKVVLNKKFEPINFSGEEKISSRLLQKSCLDFNIMVDRRWGKADLILAPKFGAALEQDAYQFCYYSPDHYELRLWQRGEKLTESQAMFQPLIRCKILQIDGKTPIDL